MERSVLFWDRQIALGRYIPFPEEGEYMKQSVPEIQCVFSPSEPSLSERIEESLRLFVLRVLTEEEPADGV